MIDAPHLAPLLDALTGPDEAWIRERLALPAEKVREGLPLAFPALARRMGRRGLAGRLEVGDARVDLGAWRRCDAAGALLLYAADPVPEAVAVELLQRGDLEEKSILLRAAALRPLGPATSRGLDEAQRTNVLAHFEAACCEGNLLVRALDAGHLTRERFDRLVLKAAFMDVALDRLHGVLERPGTDLTRMLIDLASEREAAGRPVWRDTLRLAAGAPAAGTVARVLGALEHGDAGLRLAAARALATLERPDLLPHARDRLARETKADVAHALRHALGDR